VTDITLVRQHDVEIPETDRDAARRVLFGIVDGLGERGKKQWRRFVNGLMRLEPGEMVDIRTNKARSGPFHRRHMLIETRVFEAQEKFEHFKMFRDWLKVGAGHCEWIPGPRGAVIPVPLSIAYSEIEEDEMREFHDAAMAFLRSERAIKVLWPNTPAAQRDMAITSLLNEFNE
jgi:hypothetical protein